MRLAEHALFGILHVIVASMVMFSSVVIATFVRIPMPSLVWLLISIIPFPVPLGTQLQPQIALPRQEDSACSAQPTV